MASGTVGLVTLTAITKWNIVYFQFQVPTLRIQLGVTLSMTHPKYWTCQSKPLELYGLSKIDWSRDEFCWRSKSGHKKPCNFWSWHEQGSFLTCLRLQSYRILRWLHCLFRTKSIIKYRNVANLISLKGDLNLMVLSHVKVTFVTKGSMKCNPGSVQVLSMAPPRL